MIFHLKMEPIINIVINNFGSYVEITCGRLTTMTAHYISQSFRLDWDRHTGPNDKV
jgi:hypothetical protein